MVGNEGYIVAGSGPDGNSNPPRPHVSERKMQPPGSWSPPPPPTSDPLSFVDYTPDFVKPVKRSRQFYCAVCNLVTEINSVSVAAVAAGAFSPALSAPLTGDGVESGG